MKERPRYALQLAKEDFKFSVAHFTLFPDGSAEPLHGHNYRVRVEVSGEHVDDAGLLADLAAVKRSIREACGRLDERTLIPADSDRLELREAGEALEVHVAGRAYRLPRDDALPLPLANVSIELLARLLWGEIAPALEGSRAQILTVEIEETPGQSCAYRAPLHPDA